MPQASDELRNEWEHDTAIGYLESMGYVLNSDFTWEYAGRPPTETEARAIQYLIDEWDYGGLLGWVPDMVQEWQQPE